MDRRTFLAASLTVPLAGTARADAQLTRLLYVVCPGVRDYLEFGGAGVLAFDIDNGHKFVRRIATDASKAAKPRNVKGVVACAATKKLHFTTPESLYCVDLVSEKTDWGKVWNGDVKKDTITLFTCGGVFDTATHEYSVRLVVKAERA